MVLRDVHHTPNKFLICATYAAPSAPSLKTDHPTRVCVVAVTFVSVQISCDWPSAPSMIRYARPPNLCTFAAGTVVDGILLSPYRRSSLPPFSPGLSGPAL